MSARSNWAAIALLLLPHAANAADYPHFVVVQDVATQSVNGDLRFCERAHLRGIICGRQAKIFGRERFLAQDWWYPETYVEAYTGIPVESLDVVGVQPTSDGRGIVIYYEGRR